MQGNKHIRQDYSLVVLLHDYRAPSMVAAWLVAYKHDLAVPLGIKFSENVKFSVSSV